MVPLKPCSGGVLSTGSQMLLEWITSSVFNEIAALLALAAVAGFVGLALRQPLIVISPLALLQAPRS
jgi:hypothetical protein